MVCGRVMRVLDCRHLKNHGLTEERYDKRYKRSFIPMRALPGGRKKKTFLNLRKFPRSIEFRNLTLYQIGKLEHMEG